MSSRERKPQMASWTPTQRDEAIDKGNKGKKLTHFEIMQLVEGANRYGIKKSEVKEVLKKMDQSSWNGYTGPRLNY